ncbi:MAG: PLP-dependent transferase [Desulfobulbaceae bacterium]|nr:PLP-dependent transferase [Desulfobulbaceae bacterium]
MKPVSNHLNTQIVQIAVGHDEHTGGISFPIYPSATYRHPGVGQSTGYDYTRSGNPTREVLEDALAKLEGGTQGLVFSSGMAALTTLLLNFASGDHILASEDLYGGTYRLLEQVFAKFGISTSYVDTTSSAAVQAAILPQTKALFVETPGNPLLGISDIRTLSDICKRDRILFIVDNTFLTPVLQRPLELGADIVVHSATKYLGGHSDLCAGVLVAKDAELGKRLYFLQNSTGAILPPQDSWLLIRSLKTLPLRMERHSANALQVAKWLQRQSQVEKVYYPGLPEHSGYDLFQQQAEGFGGMLSFRVNSSLLAKQLLEKLQLISFAESLGGVESLITLPAVQTHGDIPATERQRLGICNSLLRLSVGLEEPEDLIADLNQALN